MERSWGNKLARIIYTLNKMVYVTAWFYFMPFGVVYLSYYIPYYGFAEVEQ